MVVNGRAEVDDTYLEFWNGSAADGWFFDFFFVIDMGKEFRRRKPVDLFEVKKSRHRRLDVFHVPKK